MACLIIETLAYATPASQSFLSNRKRGGRKGFIFLPVSTLKAAGNTLLEGFKNFICKFL